MKFATRKYRLAAQRITALETLAVCHPGRPFGRESLVGNSWASDPIGGTGS